MQKTKYNITKSLAVAKRFGIKVTFQTFDPINQWLGGNHIELNPRIATNYIVLHEIGHVLNGHLCCREHCEYAAHGAAIALAKIYKIRLHPQAHKAIDYYSGFTKNCPARNKDWKKLHKSLKF